MAASEPRSGLLGDSDLGPEQRARVAALDRARRLIDPTNGARHVDQDRLVELAEYILAGGVVIVEVTEETTDG